MERIKRAGGMVIHKRVMGELAVSRAFGDQAFKRGIKVGRPSTIQRAVLGTYVRYGLFIG